MTKRNLTVICGGQSPEHDISLLSAANVLAQLDAGLYHVCVIYITRTGEWLVSRDYETQSGPGQLSHLIEQKDNVFVTPRMGAKGAPWLVLDEKRRMIPCDVVFPIVHGPRGEDGRLQGLLELLRLPYVGCDTLSSAMCMDKDISKQLVQKQGILTAPWVVLKRQQYDFHEVVQAVKELTYPCYVKPANMGSSVGVTRVNDTDMLAEAVDLALQYDDKVLIEQNIKGREIECAVCGNDEPTASLPGEVIPLKEFYDYKAKYIDDDGSKLDVPAQLPEAQLDEVRRLAVDIFKTLNCSGMARVDFFVTDAGSIYFNEINTIPGFTNISLYPQCWQASGVPQNKLLQRLIDLAMQRWRVHHRSDLFLQGQA